MDTIIVCTLAYIFVIALIYAPKCPSTDLAFDYVDYFPEVTEPEPMTEVEKPVVPSLSTMSIRQLKAMAKGRIKNYSRMTKSQLVDRLATA